MIKKIRPSLDTTRKYSRQYLRQREKNAMGFCAYCSQPLSPTSASRCEQHEEEGRRRGRDRYRLKVGIDLDAPLKKSGRPSNGDDWGFPAWALALLGLVSDVNLADLCDCSSTTVRFWRQRAGIPLYKRKWKKSTYKDSHP